MARQGTAIEPKTKQRVAELRGLGLTQEECAGAVDISRASVDRIMSKPEYRKIAEDIQRQRTSMKAEVASILRAGLTATDSDGEPAHGVRQRAAELYAKNPELFNEEDEGDDDGMLPGVNLIFPFTGEEQVTPSGDAQREKSTLPLDSDARTRIEEPREAVESPEMHERASDDLFTEADLHPPSEGS